MDAYHNLAASYDRLTNDVDYEATVEFYMEILRREGLSPRTVVDLACGTGSVTEILARKGYRVTGVDMSEEMLTEAAMKTMDMEQPPMYSEHYIEESREDGTVLLNCTGIPTPDEAFDEGSDALAVRQGYISIGKVRAF